MPLAWMRALKQPDGQAFLTDALDRYGYLPNPDGSNGLPVGFTAAGPQGSEIVGMTCAACHTRQIEVDGTAYRIDGGPAISDFQSFLADLDAAVGAVVVDEASFAPFAAAVLGPTGTPADVVALRQAVDAWYERYHTLMERALPQQPWGGLSGIPVPGPSEIALNASPVGSTPIRWRTAIGPRRSRIAAYVSGLAMDWIVNGVRVSPISYTAPSTVATTIPNAAGSAPASSGM